MILVLLIAGKTAKAQDSLIISNDIYRFADGVAYTYTQPLRWKQKNWITLAGLLAGTALVTLADKPVQDFFDGAEGKFYERIERIGFHYGKPYSAFTFTGTFYIGGLILNNRWAKDTGIGLGATLLTSGLLQTFLKDAVGRARPGTDVGAYRFKPFSQDVGYHSFPSGHMSVAFGISLVMAKRITYIPVKIFFYSLAASTAISRLYSDAHWISDIAFGGAIAWFCGETALRRLSVNTSRPRRNNSVSWHVTPYPGGLSLTCKL
ncbi:phosphatase PAP2 family protein [Fulvivirgaceae bacterium PWU20]|uniref:Phosphatase PAP2 family protein n=1 Tax=Chryseosolibacter indicus TaxID=2782351 RepID=A0ABS5VLG1_9BACT|nr:phosphatase PAP2 family protein [Chryseosolibacter indicus]